MVLVPEEDFVFVGWFEADEDEVFPDGGGNRESAEGDGRRSNVADEGHELSESFIGA